MRDPVVPKTIPELDALSVIEDIAAEYARRFGSPPFDLSHWNPSDQLVRALLKELELPQPSIALPYIYSYDLEMQEEIVRKLGLSPSQDCVIVPNGTVAMLFAVWWLRALGTKRLFILCPTYFPVFHACEILDLPYIPISLHRDAGVWRTPGEEITARIRSDSKGAAVWITNPIYCTGVYLGPSEIELSNELTRRGVAVVVDECLALNGLEIGRRIEPSDFLLGLYSPHKSVCINAVKFAALVFDTKHTRFFNEWADVLVGGLGVSILSALMHFLSNNFAQYQRAFLSRTSAIRARVQEIIRQQGPSFELDSAAEGYFMTCYVPRLRAIGNCEELLRDIAFNSGAIVIPGVRNHFDPNLGFNFRINLARSCPQFFAALQRSLKYLAGIA